MMSRIPMALVPGLAADGRLWQPVVDRLADLVDPTVAVCTGESITAMTDEILAEAPERFVVAGISMGGYVAIDTALRGGDRVAGLVLLNTTARAASPEQRQRGGGLLDDAGDGGFDSVVDRLAGLVSGGRPEPAAVAAAMMRDAGRDVFVRQQQAVLERPDRRAELAQLSVPTLVIGGHNDQLAPSRLSIELADLIPNAELQVLACGHMSTVEVPDEVAEAIRDWLLKL
jgi:pimeloyl-ACP methyl ester carboxylesterase